MSMRAPFVVCADFECFTEKVESKPDDTIADIKTTHQSLSKEYTVGILL